MSLGGLVERRTQDGTKGAKGALHKIQYEIEETILVHSRSKTTRNFLSSKTFNEIFFKNDVALTGEQTKMKRLACRDVHLDSFAEQPR
ncbi:hypothetical protein V9T40_013684 [Parthenolecanium corni]|uniref:Uncharacterized protein n=1 Tax=Parthenolecanium corni TaxID=536013 RepID=A0AAN9TSL0_9HEMI